MLRIRHILYLPLFLIFPLQTQAEGLLGDYDTSEKQQIDQRRTVGGGSRSGCSSDFPSNSITLLVPKAKVVHETTESNPTFFLYSKTSSNKPLEFTLVDPQKANPLVEKALTISQTGIQKIELPQSVLLEKDTLYLWFVTIPCDRNIHNQKYYEVLGSSIRRIEAMQENQSKDSAALAAVYASNGLWYDALKLAVKNHSDPNYLQQLLSSVGLENVQITDKHTGEIHKVEK